MNSGKFGDAGGLDAAFRPVYGGLFFAALTLLFGFALGIVFGLNEDLIKSRLAAAASTVTATVYRGDPAAAKPVLEKSWTYMQRAHLHAGGLGAAAIGLSVVLILVGSPAAVARVTSLALGAGGLGYSIFWLWAGFRAPGLGGTGAAKESLKWLAMPASGAFVLGTVAVVLLILRALARRPGAAAGAPANVPAPTTTAAQSGR
jgi:hypothetical protein